MKEIVKRIKQVREELNLSQTEFAVPLNLKRNSITQIETGRRNPSDRTLIDICREFNVNEDWLRHGRGEMFLELDREDEITKWLGTLVKPDAENEFIKKFIHMLSKLDVDDWEVLEKMAALMLKEDQEES